MAFRDLATSVQQAKLVAYQRDSPDSYCCYVYLCVQARTVIVSSTDLPVRPQPLCRSSGRAMQVGMREREEGAARRAQADLVLTRRVQQQQPLWQQQQRPPQHRARKSVWGQSG